MNRKPDQQPSSAYINTRRPSWTPSLPEQPTNRERVLDNIFISSSFSQQQRRSRKRRVEDISSFSPFERNTNPSSFNFSFLPPTPGPSSLFSGAKRSTPFIPPPVPETQERPRKRVIHAEAFPDPEAQTATNESNNHNASEEPSSPEDGSNLRRSLQIDMKGLVGDAVGNMSISPSSRDIVLAARRGLFILDLESPLEVPRFLPQGGTWDVADVQWNPHPARDQYIVSTSSEKLLIWNILLTGKTNIEHILKCHYRAITDINWHTTECDTVASTGIDSWIYAWDLREPRRPIFGLSAFNAGGTQIKWNRKDPNVLASSHANEVLIWDRRKGSIPLTRFSAHSAKIYGIDWSHNMRNEIVTCSLDKTIKIWDINQVTAHSRIPSSHSDFDSSELPSKPYRPKCIIKTTYPVWRALNLPFGEGLLSLAQRGETMLELYATGKSGDEGGCMCPPLEVFEGHTDVVKEFVWRKGGPDEFQLITWSKDRTLRFWPIDSELLQKVGHKLDLPARGRSRLSRTRTSLDKPISYRNPLEPQQALFNQQLSNPIGNRPILAEVRAPLPPRRAMLPPTTMAATTTMNVDNLISQPHFGSAARMGGGEGGGASGSLGILSTSAHSTTMSIPPPHGHSGTSTTGGVTFVEGRSKPIAITTPSEMRGKGGTMSKGNVGGKSVARMDAFTWLSYVKVGGRRGSSSGAASVIDNTNSNGANDNGTGEKRGRGGQQVTATAGRASLSRGPSSEDPRSVIYNREQSLSGNYQGRKGPEVRKGSLDSRSQSGSRAAEDKTREGESGAGSQSLQDEITSVLTKLTSFSKIRLEKHDLTKKRTCTLGLQGPWGERSSVFIRVTFTFPREYPHALHPEGTPKVDLEHNPLISMKTRAFILKHLRIIRERKRPCLEACLSFLLFGNESEEPLGKHPSVVDGESSDEDEPTHKRKDLTVSIIRGDKNLAEPRTSQGAFGPNGELVCFFRAAPRAVRPVLRNLSTLYKVGNPATSQEMVQQPQSQEQQKQQDSTSVATQPQLQSQPQHQVQADISQTRVFHTPTFLSDAIKRLTLAAVDRTYIPDPRRQRADEMTRVMTELLAISQHKPRRESDVVGDLQKGYPVVTPSVVQMIKSTVFVASIAPFSGPDKKVALEYVFRADSLHDVCETNARVAGELGRYDHERAFKTLQTLLKNLNSEGKWPDAACERLAKKVFMQLYSEFANNKDIQMLAMLAVLILQTPYAIPSQPPLPPVILPKQFSMNLLPSAVRSPRVGPFDYFSISQAINQQPVSPALGKLPSPIAPPLAANLSSSNSSRGSWTNIFNTGRQFVHDTLNPGLMTPREISIPNTEKQPLSPRTIERGKSHQGSTDVLPVPGGGVGHRKRKDSHLTSSSSTTSRSWNETIPQQRASVSGGSGTGSAVSFWPSGQGLKHAPNLRWTSSKESAVSGSGISEKQVVIFEPPPLDRSNVKPVFEDDLVRQLVMHVHVYAEILLKWQMYQKRIELLKTVQQGGHVKEGNRGIQHLIGITQLCNHCGFILHAKHDECQGCHLPRTTALCSICRLPVKGLSRTCLHCHHISHISCWNDLEVPICPTGCGCFCTVFPTNEANLTRPSTRMAFSSPLASPSALLIT